MAPAATDVWRPVSATEAGCRGEPAGLLGLVELEGHAGRQQVKEHHTHDPPARVAA
jgi:hypothetical protein